MDKEKLLSEILTALYTLASRVYWQSNESCGDSFEEACIDNCKHWRQCELESKIKDMLEKYAK